MIGLTKDGYLQLLLTVILPWEKPKMEISTKHSFILRSQLNGN